MANPCTTIAIPPAAYELLAEQLADFDFGQTNLLLSDGECCNLRNHVLQLHSQQLLLQGETGRDTQAEPSERARGDLLYWLQPNSKHPVEQAFQLNMQGLIDHLNLTCYAGIRSSEFMLALYEPGTCYERHIDTLRSNRSGSGNVRLYTLITYLNDDWSECDGGQLKIYQNQQTITVAPVSGATVCFRSSQIEHEVLQTHTRRMSITGWLLG